MKKAASVLLWLIPLLVFSASAISLEHNSRELSATAFMAIDLTYVELPASQYRGIEPVPWIIWRNPTTQESGLWIMTLNAETGAQMGSRLQMEFDKSQNPVDILWAKHFGVGVIRGVEPAPWVIFTDYTLYTFPVNYNRDGTPVAGTPVTFIRPLNPVIYGNAVCAAELPGSQFADGMARLFIGTDLGYIAVLIYSYSAGPLVADILPVSGAPIVNLGPIPQFGYIALGVITENEIKGMQYSLGTGKSPQTGSFTTNFALRDPRLSSLADFDTFGPHDMALINSQDSVRIIITDNTDDLGLSYINAQQSGTEFMNLSLEQHNGNIKSVVTGSLLMLMSDESSVAFDPDYSETSGLSGCDVTITDTISDVCGYLCGDADGSGWINILDVSYLISYLYKGGPASNPPAASDADGNGAINILDVSRLINYLYKGGAAPICP